MNIVIGMTLDDFGGIIRDISKVFSKSPDVLSAKNALQGDNSSCENRFKLFMTLYRLRDAKINNPVTNYD